jgi:hypothetical protein
MNKQLETGTSSTGDLLYPKTGTMFFSVKIKRAGGKKSMTVLAGSVNYADHQTARGLLEQILSAWPDGRMSVRPLTEITVIVSRPVSIRATPAIE